MNKPLNPSLFFGESQMISNIKGYLRFAWIIINSSLVILVHLVLMGLLSPIFHFGGKAGKILYWKLEETCYGGILCILDFTLSSLNHQIIETGDCLDEILQQEDNTILFMPNHQSVADVLVCLSVFVARDRYAETVMWIIGKNQRCSNFGLMAWLHDDCFLDTRKNNQTHSLRELKMHLFNSFLPRKRRCLVLFPEGGFFAKKKESNIRFAKKNDLPMLHHCSYPRLGALQVILNVLLPNDEDRREIKEHKQEEETEHKKKSSNSTVGEINPHLSCGNPITSNVSKMSSLGKEKDNMLIERQQLVDNSAMANQDRCSTIEAKSVCNVKGHSDFSSTKPDPQISADHRIDGLADQIDLPHRHPKTLTKIIDVTIGYQDGNPIGFMDIMLGLRRGSVIVVNYRVFDVKSIPTKGDNDIQKFMYRLYQEKDEMLLRFGSTVGFNEWLMRKQNDLHLSCGKRIRHQKWKYYLFNLFYATALLSFYFISKFLYLNLC